ncbi:MAG: hypothetical protein GY765_31335 [bacterium]|nr:hypothetical protein [bacterium]
MTGKFFLATAKKSFRDTTNSRRIQPAHEEYSRLTDDTAGSRIYSPTHGLFVDNALHVYYHISVTEEVTTGHDVKRN